MTELYRHFDAAGQLLYVGISSLSTVRLGQHRSRAPWFEQIATITIERFKTEESARNAERNAIAAERPQFNRTGVLKFGISRNELAVIAKKAGTTLGYLADQIANGHRQPSAELAMKLYNASQQRLSLAALRPDLWGDASISKSARKPSAERTA